MNRFPHCVRAVRAATSLRATTRSLLISSLLVGCGAQPSGQWVRGVITYNDKPVTQGLINFAIEGQRPEGGPIQQDGSYSCRLPAGAYRVRIDSPAALPPDWKEGDRLPPESARGLPAKYADFRSSGLEVQIGDQGGEITHDFRLP